MQLLVYITNKVEHVTPILTRLMEMRVGATVVNCEGMVRAISGSSVDAPPIFGSLRHFLNPTGVEGKMIFAAMSDEQVPNVIAVIHEVAGDLAHANAGVLFTLPISYSETRKEDCEAE